MLFARAPKADAAYWPGRRLLAVFDAVGWPALWVAAVAYAPLSSGIVGKVVTALALISAVRRVRCALWRNERYWFTAWTWGIPVATMAVLAWAVELL